MSRCPACNSPSPKLHPAVQIGGEVWVCRNDYHGVIILSDADMIANAVRTARPQYTKSAPRWSAVMDTFSIGRTAAIELCARFGFDAEEKRVRR